MHLQHSTHREFRLRFMLQLKISFKRTKIEIKKKISPFKFLAENINSDKSFHEELLFIQFCLISTKKKGQLLHGSQP